MTSAGTPRAGAFAPPFWRAPSEAKRSITFAAMAEFKTLVARLDEAEQFLERAANVSTVQVAYGGETGGAKRVNINVTTPELDLSFNIRNTSDKGTTEDPDRVYPYKLQSAYKMKGEPIQTVFSDD